MTVDETKKPGCSNQDVEPVVAFENTNLDAEKPRLVADEDHEVFKSGTEHANFRVLGWIRTTVILTKLCFATGVLGIPSAMVVVGYGPGIVLLLAWSAITTYYAYIMYQFRMRYSNVHNISDAAFILGGPVLRDIMGGLFLLCWILATGSGLIGMATGLKVLADGRVCTVVFTVVAAVCTGAAASIRTLGKLTILTWLGFASIFTAMFVVVVGVTQQSRPAAAPQEGPYDLGFVSIAHPGFVPGLTAALNLFSGYGSTPTFMPVIAEMRSPKAFPRSLFFSQGFLVACYISFGMVMYAYCGQYVASPSLSSAGGVIAKVAYGIAIPGLIMTSTLWTHVAAKYLFVRFLRNTRHLQDNSVIHWATWLSCTIGITAIAFIVAEAIPFFNYLLGLIASLCCAPCCLMLPAAMSLYMDKGNYLLDWKFKSRTAFNVLVLVIGAFLTVAGTYTTIQSIIDAYRTGVVGSAFSCA